MDRRSRRDWGDEDDRPIRKSNAGLMIVLGVLGAGVLLVAICAGGSSMLWLLFDAGPPAVQVAEMPVAEEVIVKVGPVRAEDPVDEPAPPIKERIPKKPKRPPVKAPDPELDPEPEPGPAVKPGPPPPADLVPDVLAKTTKATAFIRVELGDQAATGSGFVLKTGDDTAYVVTNYHVVNLLPEEPKLPSKKGFPFGPKGFWTGPGPGGMFGPKNVQPVPKPKPHVTVVLYNGTPEEQALVTEVVAVDEPADLAVLRIRGARNLPEGIDVGQQTTATTRNAVYIFGFPGKNFRQGRPVLTIGKGEITRLRRDANNDIIDVHIDGELNPGNSGGPVIDANGRLVGVAVATVPGKRIGFAVPAGVLTPMLKGRIFAAVVYQNKRQGPFLEAMGESWEHNHKSNIIARNVITWRPTDNPNPADLRGDEYEILTRLTDPMLKLGAIHMYFAQTEDVPAKPGPNGWTRIADSAEVRLKIQDQVARGKFLLPKDAIPDDTFAFQFSFVNADRQTVFTQPHLARLTFPKNPKSVTLNITRIPDPGTAQFIADMAPKWLPGKIEVKAKAHDRLTLEIDVVDDPETIQEKVTFGTVTDLQGRTFAIVGKKIDLPLPNADEVAKALEDLKMPDIGRRMAGANQLAKAYAPLPERRVEVAKALTGQATDIHVGKFALRALLVWAGPENFDGVVLGLDNGFARSEACELLLSRFKGPAAAAAVAKLLTNPGTIPQASPTLKAMGPSAEKAVLPYITNRDIFCAKEACAILKEIGGAASIPPLTAVADGNVNFVSPVAREALTAIRARTKMP